MAKSKADLLKDAQNAGLVAVDVDEDAFTADQLKGMVSGEIPVTERHSSTVPLQAPDGHWNLTQEDIDNRDA